MLTSTGRWKASAVLLATVLASMSLGCFSYSADITAEPEATALRNPTSEVAALERTLAHVADEFGLRRDAYLAELRDQSIESKEYEFVVVVSYYRPEQEFGDNRVLVNLLVNKESGDPVLVIRDLDWPRRTRVTEALERALVREAEAALPGYQIRIHRGTVGPSLGP